MSAPQYTECVDRAAYEDPGFGPEIFVAVAGLVYAIGTFGISLIFSMVAAMSALMKVCDYILYGKLVCLEDDRCAVGRGLDAAQIDRPPVLEEPQLDRNRAVSMGDRRHRDVDHGIAQHRLGGRDADDLAVACAGARTDPDGIHGRTCGRDRGSVHAAVVCSVARIE